MKKYTSAALAACAIIAVAGASLLAGCQAKADPVKPFVKTANATVGQVVKVQELSGVLVPEKSLNIFGKLSGIANRVTADVGDHVREGQLLVQIDTKELNAQLAVAEAAGVTVKDQASQAKIGIESARLNLDMAQKNYDRMSALFKDKAVTQSALDDASSRLDLAKASFDNANKQYSNVSGAGVAQAEAQANLIRVQISNSTITSPISGTVVSRSINTGELAAPGMPLMSIADTDHLKFQGNASQDEIVLLNVGDSVALTIDGMSGPRYEGKITQIGPIAAATGQYFPLTVSITNDGKLLAGMTAKAMLTLTSPQGVLVPPSAVASEGGKSYVYVIGPDNKASRRLVELGIASADAVLVVSGIEAGETVAISGTGMLSDGMEVSK
ncbi:MAG: efflux RND transporter periplasmic adaptor subunit [Treponema sp.]|nr:efflux RND transporter periplasmic adaptor subunit [Treponema sp.]